ncbi:MAG: winged helix-turn-helix transcriptional regulator [Thermoplasmata archaeon]|nr:winged helix-turn-helix transcriptional regulator [Thermoplasmata archaeon]
MGDGPLTDFEIYYTQKGLVQVSNEVHRRILAEIRNSDKSLTDLSHSLKKAQSTLSVHLNKMVEEGLISTYDDPQDSRRKVYTLISVRFAYSRPPNEKSMDMIINTLSDIVEDPAKTRDAMMRFMFLGLDGIGLSVEPMASILGGLHATALYGALTGSTLEETVANAREYYSKMGIGEVHIYSLNPLTIILSDKMTMTEGSAKSFGGYASGFMMKVLEDATGNQYEIVSSEVYGSEFNNFKFVLQPVKNRFRTSARRSEGLRSRGLRTPSAPVSRLRQAPIRSRRRAWGPRLRL